SRGPATFRQRDLVAAIKAMIAAGCGVDRAEIGKDGKIVVIAGRPEKQVANNAGPNEWDQAV
ncbi:MAG TPA: hypothetical protein VGR70_10340, partial [Stellaceae bacterium]|nr:hypothetical protein [Stellaceae bacterium]